MMYPEDSHDKRRSYQVVTMALAPPSFSCKYENPPPAKTDGDDGSFDDSGLYGLSSVDSLLLGDLPQVDRASTMNKSLLSSEEARLQPEMAFGIDQGDPSKEQRCTDADEGEGQGDERYLAKTTTVKNKKTGKDTAAIENKEEETVPAVIVKECKNRSFAISAKKNEDSKVDQEWVKKCGKVDKGNNNKKDKQNRVTFSDAVEKKLNHYHRDEQVESKQQKVVVILYDKDKDNGDSVDDAIHNTPTALGSSIEKEEDAHGSLFAFSLSSSFSSVSSSSSCSSYLMNTFETKEDNENLKVARPVMTAKSDNDRRGGDRAGKVETLNDYKAVNGNADSHKNIFHDRKDTGEKPKLMKGLLSMVAGEEEKETMYRSGHQKIQQSARKGTTASTNSCRRGIKGSCCPSSWQHNFFWRRKNKHLVNASIEEKDCFTTRWKKEILAPWSSSARCTRHRKNEEFHGEFSLLCRLLLSFNLCSPDQYADIDEETKLLLNDLLYEAKEFFKAKKKKVRRLFESENLAEEYEMEKKIHEMRKLHHTKDWEFRFL